MCLPVVCLTYACVSAKAGHTTVYNMVEFFHSLGHGEVGQQAGGLPCQSADGRTPSTHYFCILQGAQEHDDFLKASCCMRDTGKYRKRPRTG